MKRMIAVLAAAVLTAGCAHTRTRDAELAEARELTAPFAAEIQRLERELAEAKMGQDPAFGTSEFGSEVDALRAQVEDLKRFDARVVCGEYCSHRGKPWKRLPPCR